MENDKMSEWVRWDWSYEKPYPETPETMVRVLLDWEDPEKERNSTPDIVSKWDWGTGAGIRCYMVIDK